MATALIVGGGISGAATAIVLSRNGLTVDLVEREPSWNVLGSGITLIGPALRALQHLGVLEACLDVGFGVREMTKRTIDGAEIETFPLPSSLGPEYPGLLGLMRPTLHAILTAKAREEGLEVRTGTWPTSIENVDDRARVTFNDGSSHDYDLVIGADGLRSQTRTMVFGDMRPTFQNQGCFRAVLPRHPDVDMEFDFVGWPGSHPGFTPMGDGLMYLYCNTAMPDASLIPQAEIPARIREVIAPFGGVVGDVRELITDPQKVNYRPFETILVPPPWHRGRVVLVGDSAHSTTPQLAAGGAMCLEDAVVLGKELERHESIPAALAAYSERRYERCRFVVETSVQISHWQNTIDAPGAETATAVTQAAYALLAQPF